jgi:hypothetical protein
VSELLPIAVEYLEAAAAAAGDSPAAAAAAALQQSQTQVQLQQQQQQPAAQPDAPFPASTSSSSMLLSVLDAALVTQQLVEYSLAIAAAVPSTDMAPQKFAWRNGWFLKRRVAPQHAQWLRRAGCQDLLLQYAKE